MAGKEHAPEQISTFADIEAGRLARGNPIDPTFEEVRVRCRACAGVTVFPVRIGKARRTGWCLHCGAEL